VVVAAKEATATASPLDPTSTAPVMVTTRDTEAIAVRRAKVVASVAKSGERKTTSLLLNSERLLVRTRTPPEWRMIPSRPFVFGST